MGISFLVFLLAGFATGVITGLVGASAIVVFVPIVLLFLNYNIFALIGVSLAVDVFVSLIAVFMYKKFKHIDFKTGLYLSMPAIAGAVIGGIFSKSISGTYLLWISSLAIAFTGAMMFRRKIKLNEVHKLGDYPKFKFIIALILSFFVGFIGGGLGAAGGLSIFFLLIFFLNFETHIAIGTSIFIMFFISLFGGLSHISYVNAMGFNWELLVYAVIGGIAGVLLSSKLSNRISEEKLNKLVGTILFFLGILTFVNSIFM